MISATQNYLNNVRTDGFINANNQSFWNTFLLDLFKNNKYSVEEVKEFVISLIEELNKSNEVNITCENIAREYVDDLEHIIFNYNFTDKSNPTISNNKFKRDINNIAHYSHSIRSNSICCVCLEMRQKTFKMCKNPVCNSYMCKSCITAYLTYNNNDKDNLINSIFICLLCKKENKITKRFTIENYDSHSIANFLYNLSRHLGYEHPSSHTKRVTY